MKAQPDLAEVATARAALREVIREAHEALEDLRAERRGTQADRAAIVSEVREGLAFLQAEINRIGIAQGAEAQRAYDQAVSVIQEQVNRVQAHLTVLLKTTTPDELASAIITQMAAEKAAQRAAGE